jgi:hypothetical protein
MLTFLPRRPQSHFYIPNLIYAYFSSSATSSRSFLRKNNICLLFFLGALLLIFENVISTFLYAYSSVSVASSAAFPPRACLAASILSASGSRRTRRDRAVTLEKSLPGCGEVITDGESINDYLDEVITWRSLGDAGEVITWIIQVAMQGKFNLRCSNWIIDGEIQFQMHIN